MRSRAAKYPPMLDAITATTTRYIPLPILKVVADTPNPVQGEIDDNPIPVPKETRMRLRAAVATAPAMIAGQDTPEDGKSTAVDVPSGETSMG